MELADRPEEITVIATADEVQRLFDRLAQEDIQVFYAKTPVEFGFLGKSTAGAPGSGTAPETGSA